MKIALFLPLLYYAIGRTTAGYCAHFCFVPYRTTMRTVLVNVNDWSLEVMSPIQTILRKTEDVKGARRKLNWACGAVQKYRHCLDACTPSFQKKVVLIGMGPWNELCSALQVRHAGMEEFLRCFKEHGARIDAQCEPHEIAVKELLINSSQHIKVHEYDDMGDLCRAMQEFEECYKNAERPCEEKALKLWGRLQQSANKAFREMLAIDVISQRLPFECKSPQTLTTTERIYRTQPPSTTPAAVVTEIVMLNKMQPTNFSTSTASMQYQRFVYSSAVIASGVLLFRYCQNI